MPRAVRAVRRSLARADARVRHGGVVTHLERVVGSVPPPGPRPARPRRSGRPKVVEVSTYPLHPRHSGGQLRGWHLAEALAHEVDADVSVVSLTPDPRLAGIHHDADRLAEITVALPPEHASRETAVRLLTGDVAVTDVAAGLMWNGIPELRDRLAEELDGAAAAVLVQPYLVDAVSTLASGLPTVCDAHNDELLLKRSILPDNVAGRWLLDQVDRLERSAVEGAALVTATTDADLASLDGRYHVAAPTAVVPNGVDTTAIEVVVGPERHRRRHELTGRLGLRDGHPVAFFIGSGHLPNIEAGRAVIEAARHAPDVEFVLAGRHSELLGVSHPPRNVHLLGEVDDPLHDLLLSGCDVALNPMSGGSGSNLKLLEYLAAGAPVVSTAVGARGIDADAAGVLTVQLDGLAAGVDAIAGETGTDRSLAGRRYVEEHCDWRAIGRQFAALIATRVLS